MKVRTPSQIHSDPTMRSLSRYLAAGMVLVAVAACSDSTVPSSPSARTLTPTPPAFDLSTTGHSFGLQSSDFTLTSRGGSFAISGLYTVTFPANSVCNPDNTKYGSTEWDKACSTLRDGQSIKVHAVLSLASGGLAIDFTPALRFSPSSQVTISTGVFAPVLKANKDYFLAHPSALNFLAISYSPGLGASSVNDYKTDSSLITHVNLTTGQIWRRVKHFSGYNISTGQACDPSPDNPDCVSVDTGPSHP
jgi:hypothetical protein